MKVIKLNCPSCSAPLNIESGRNTFYCSYCGEKLFIDDGTKRTEHTKNINVSKYVRNINETTIRNIDEAEIRKADAEARKAKYAAIVSFGLIFLIIVMWFF